MARQQISQEWDIVEIVRDQNDKFHEKKTRLGKYTACTAKLKIAEKFPTYRFREIPYHSSGGRFVDADGSTAELLPAYR
jgi:hypothetical protein